VGRNIDNAAHIGGLLAGCWLGYAVIPKDAVTLAKYWSGTDTANVSRLPRPAIMAVLGFVVVAIVVSVAVMLGPGDIRG
jgi:membrane associated rhomboid family serine protease